MLKAVPRISLTVPFRSFAIDLNRIVLAISMISSRGIDLVCLMFFSFFLSRGGSFKALMTSEDADGTTDTAACRFWIVSLTVTRLKKSAVAPGTHIMIPDGSAPRPFHQFSTSFDIFRGKTKFLRGLEQSAKCNIGLQVLSASHVSDVRYYNSDSALR